MVGKETTARGGKEERSRGRTEEEDTKVGAETQHSRKDEMKNDRQGAVR